MTMKITTYKALQDFTIAVTEKLNQLTPGEPEEQLRSPFENLISNIADIFVLKVVCTGETQLPDRIGKPDYATHLNGLLAGYVELKAPGVGGGEFSPVAHSVYEFKVSGLKIVQSWLKYRMKKGSGKKSSPLDEIRPERWTSQFATELLELIWVLEATIECYPEQVKLLTAVIKGECFKDDKLPPVPEEMRKPPKVQKANTSLQLHFGDDN